MANRPYAGVIKDFLDRRHELMSARRESEFYYTCDVYPENGAPTYGLYNIKTGLRLNLTVPTDRDDLASLKLSSPNLNANESSASLVRVDFDWRSSIIHRIATIEPKTDTHLGRLVRGIGGTFVHPSYRVSSAYDASHNMLGIIAEKRKRVVDSQLELNKSSSTTGRIEPLFALNG